MGKTSFQRYVFPPLHSYICREGRLICAHFPTTDKEAKKAMNGIVNTEQQAGALSVIDALAIQARTFARGAATNLLQLGRVLTEARPLVPHGEWGEWVETNAYLPKRRAEEYMKAWLVFGNDPRAAQLGPSQIIALLPMSDEERETMLARDDLDGLSVRELKEAIRAQREELRAEALAEARDAIDRAEEAREAAEEARDAAEARVEELERREAEAAEDQIEAAMERGREEGREELNEANDRADHFAEMARQAVNEKAALEREKRQAQAELDEANDILRELTEQKNRAEEALLNLKSAQARGEAATAAADDLTLEAFGRAVREFVGLVARMPYMQAAFAGMAQADKMRYAELLCTVEGWADGARRALETVSVRGDFDVQ